MKAVRRAIKWVHVAKCLFGYQVRYDTSTSTWLIPDTYAAASASCVKTFCGRFLTYNGLDCTAPGRKSDIFPAAPTRTAAIAVCIGLAAAVELRVRVHEYSTTAVIQKN